MTNDLILALRQHAFFVAQCTLAQAKIAGMTAENMKRQALGCSMAYDEDDFKKIDIPDWNAVIGAFNG